MATERGVAIFDPFRAMDALDDTAILAELEGRVIDKWVYHFPQEGEEIWGLSKVGVDQACREMALQGEVIREEEVSYELDPTDSRYILFKAFASRVAVSQGGGEVRLDRTAGMKRQCVFVVTREGITDRVNTFWFEQGSIKALRNARLRLLSEEVRSKIIALAKAKGKVRIVQEDDGEKPATFPSKGKVEHWCPVHDVAFTEKKGKYGVFWSHKLETGKYCNESMVEKEMASKPGTSPVTEPTNDILSEDQEPVLETDAGIVDMGWVTETLSIISWKPQTALSWLKAQVKAEGTDLTKVLNSLPADKLKIFVDHISSMREASGRQEV